MTMGNDADAWDRLCAGFMSPEIVSGVSFVLPDDTDCGWIPADAYDPRSMGPIADRNTGAGYFCRLSAPGYLDATEWSGPFDTEAEAEAHLLEMYGEE